MARVEVRSEVAGTVWSLERDPGETVAAGEAVVILESMKMEVPVEAPVAGRVAELAVAKDDPVEEGQVVAILDTED